MAKTVEEIYQKKTPKEHILLRPDTYIGATDKDTQMMYVWDGTENKIVLRNVCFAPGLYKIFDEILVNAADNKIRDPRMSRLCVDIRVDKGEISVFNDGKGIPIEMHSKEGVYVPELIFGHLLTSSNYDDKEKKVTGGRNGYGAKLCNIFSHYFEVDTADGRSRYIQRFENNMDTTHKPEITPCREEYTRITFRPDLARFGMDILDEDIVSLMRRRVYDMCGVLRGTKIFLDGERLGPRSFREYIGLYVGDSPVVHQRIGERWEIAVGLSDEQFHQVSFVNAIATTKGGTHVSHVLEQLVEPLTEAVKKKEKGLEVKALHVRSSLFLFINALIENPSFDSQTKENLTLRASAFGSKCQPLDSFVKEVVKGTGIVERIAALSRAKQSAQLKKSDGTKASRLSGIPKLEDANNAGTRRSQECTLILTEGDSAKTLAVSGLSVVGRDNYGVFPLRGKLLNVREASHQQIMANAEISAIKKILGLQQGKDYPDTQQLRYGHIMIMTDQDHDGSHIKGLIINFLDHFFPSLLRINGFLQEFITPIIRATRRGGGEVRDFFTIPEFESFRAQEQGRAGAFHWTVKYYKGLGTSTSRDAKQYFSDLSKHLKNFVPCDDSDRALIDLAFNKKKADMRKAWLAEFVQGTFLDQSQPRIPISDFINKELILFSMADNVRSIPSVVDGLKPGQRKVLFSCFKKNLRNEIKVAQLVGYVSEQSAYHHGEASLCATIVNLAQDFVGSNNINILLPLGSFGSRLQGGKDSASPRYIYTSLSPLTRLLFPEHDDPVLSYLTDDNMQVEPEFYVPVIPMVLVNGADGIGTGWSTSIPNYNPLDLVSNVRALIAGREMTPMVPYYRNFRGDILQVSGSGESMASPKFIVSGISETEDGIITIKELPVGTWTQAYKEYLETLVQNGTVRDYKEYHTEKTVDFVIAPIKTFPLKLSTTISTTNMICFDPEGRIRKYSSPLDIIREFYSVRLRFYELRKEHRLGVLRMELQRLRNRVRFIKEISEGSLVVSRRPLAEICGDLVARGYEPVGDKAENGGGYEYLLSMQISSLTREKMERLAEEHAKKQEEYNLLAGKAPTDLWSEDLDQFEKAYKAMVEEEKKEYDMELSKKKKGQKLKSVKMPLSKVEIAKDKKTKKAEKAESGKAKKTESGKAKKAESGKVKKAESGKVKKAESGKAKKTESEPKKRKLETQPKKKQMKLAKDSFIVQSDESSEEDMPWSKYK